MRYTQEPIPYYSFIDRSLMAYAWLSGLTLYLIGRDESILAVSSGLSYHSNSSYSLLLNFYNLLSLSSSFLSIMNPINKLT